MGAVALALVTAGNLALVGGMHNGSRAECPSGYFPRDVRIHGQRLESDPKVRNGVVVQNDRTSAVPDLRYVPARVCVRPLTADEADDLWWDSVGAERNARQGKPN